MLSFDWLQSLGLRSTVFFHALEGRLEPGAEPAERPYGVVRTPSNPHYYFGNSLVVSGAPQPGDHARWMRLFEQAHPGARHRVFQCDLLDGAAGDVRPFLDDGFRIERMEVLATREVEHHCAVSRGLEVRALESDADWQAQFELRLAVAERDEGRVPSAPLQAFLAGRIAFYRDAIERGHGDWWGVFDGAQLLASLGLFGQEQYARYQLVATHPDTRGQGLCTTLVWETASRALEQHPERPLLMLADEEYHAQRIYKSLGFRPFERFVNLVREP